MSDIRANTISDAAGTGPIDLHKQSAAKAWGDCDAAGVITSTGSLNVSSVTDNGTNGKQFNYTNNFANRALGAAGVFLGIGSWAHGGALIYVNSSTTAHYSVRYFNGASYIDVQSCFSANGDLA